MRAEEAWMRPVAFFLVLLSFLFRCEWCLFECQGSAARFFIQDYNKKASGDCFNTTQVGDCFCFFSLLLAPFSFWFMEEELLTG
jgi:hypothetical protein